MSLSPLLLATWAIVAVGMALWDISATDLAPVTMAAALHFNLLIPNFGNQEFMRYSPYSYRFKDGGFHLCEVPGLGVVIDEEHGALQLYQRAFLPVNRLEDGSMTNW